MSSHDADERAPVSDPIFWTAIIGEGVPAQAERVVRYFALLLSIAVRSGTAQGEMLTLLQRALKEGHEKMLQELQVEKQGS